MDLNEELKLMLDYSDYERNTLQVIKQELEMLSAIYPTLRPEKGWGEGNAHNLAMQGRIPVVYQGISVFVPFAICFPLAYPKSPPWCNVLASPAEIINPSKRVDNSGRVSIGILRKWNGTKDSLEVLQKCGEYFTKNFPIFDLGSMYLSETWRVRTQTENLLKEKYALDKIKREVAREIKCLEEGNGEDQKVKLMREIESVENWVKKIGKGM